MSAQLADVETPIFIGGTGRSGTTLLLRLIADNPEIFVFRWETQFLVSPNGLMPLIDNGFERAACEGFTKSLRGRWFRRTVRRGQPGAYEAGLCVDLSKDRIESAASAFLAEASQSLEPAARREVGRRLIRTMIAPAMDERGCRRWCEQTPRNLL